eukprot:2032665-Alexandrium_andersonii.AAC.1
MSPGLAVDARPTVAAALQLEPVWPPAWHVFLWLLIFPAGVRVGRRGAAVAAAPSPMPPRGQSRAEKWLDGAEPPAASKFIRGGQ